MDRIDPVDARLLDEFQRDLPLVAQPFAAIGSTLSLAETEVIARLARLTASGAVARVGATVRPNTAGASTLAALAVPAARVLAQLLSVFGSRVVGYDPSVHASDSVWNRWRIEAPTISRIRDSSAARGIWAWRLPSAVACVRRRPRRYSCIASCSEIS